ncbi:uncharacterized protein V2V93DRAFT_232866 [Kockiozyma suomiensis]|uniref:uncharacterized protein n=1 Tax=Kockiozyma suomiensis TaxID=1337062 RepID=UPI003343952E
MDITFIAFHDLTSNCRALFASDSIVLVLGYEPSDFEARSFFDFVHPDQSPYCRKLLREIVFGDKAVVITYLRLLCRDESYVDCECMFSVVFDVLVAATRVYQWTLKSEDRIRLAPLIHRAFAASSLIAATRRADILTPKFNHIASSLSSSEHEPRTALILNRASISLPIMYAANSSTQVLEISPSNLTGWSFWDCMNAESLIQAQLAFERAKENDSIAYLRFFWCDPRSHQQPATRHIRQQMQPCSSNFDSSVSACRTEVEAVVSCSSDGLVIVLRRALPIITLEQAMLVKASDLSLHSDRLQGGFASPWGMPLPFLPPPIPRVALDTGSTHCLRFSGDKIII